MGDVFRWLDSLGLQQYADVFREHAIEWHTLPDLDHELLREVGVNAVGHRIALLKAIESLGADASEAGAAGSGPVAVDAPAAPATGQAERRQLTVMFCDLVGSTALSAKLDPEDLRALIARFQETASSAIARFGGFVARYMGDGILVYFGYPQAHEDDAARAVRAGRAIVADLGRCGAEDPGGVALEVRVGIATGPVVVGDIIGEGAAQEAAVIGETPNLAARLQAIAPPGQVIVSSITHGLVGDQFQLEPLGEHLLKGIGAPTAVWRVAGESNVEDRELPRAARTLIGRREELGLLLRARDAACSGHGQVVTIQGEAGIGKSRLIEALREQLGDGESLWVAARCSPYHTSSVLFPVIEHLKRVVGWRAGDSDAERLEKLQEALAEQSLPLEEAVPIYADLLSLDLPESMRPAVKPTPKQQRERTLDALAGWLFDQAERRPVIQVWEDLHWADPTTLELLQIYIEQSPTARMLNLLTYRPEFTPEWSAHSHLTPIALGRLERAEVEMLVREQAGSKVVSQELLEHVVSKADGIPLFVEELSKTILESAIVNDEGDRYVLTGALSEVSIPTTLQDTLMARLDREPALRELAQLASVLGRQFDYETLRRLSAAEAPILKLGLDRLVESGILYQRGRPPKAHYHFRHALIQDAAYESLLKSTRLKLHRRVAASIAQGHPALATASPELLAHHYAGGGEFELASEYWRKAGEGARSKSANLEAIAYFSRAVQQLGKLPADSRHAEQELVLQISIGQANIVAKGHSASGAEVAYARALELCNRLGDEAHKSPALMGLWRYQMVSKTLVEAKNIGYQLQAVSEAGGAVSDRVVACYAIGGSAFFMGELVAARAYLDRVVADYEPGQRIAESYRTGQDPGVAARAYQAMNIWLLGFPLEACESMAAAISLADRIDDLFSQAFARCFPGAILAQLRGDDVEPSLRRGLALAGEGGFPLWATYGGVVNAYERFQAAPSPESLDVLRRCVERLPDTGVHIVHPYYGTLLAGAYLETGRFLDGLRLIEQLQGSAKSRQERWWDAELARWRGELLLAASTGSEAEARESFRAALNIARNQGAVSLELRAAMSLARSAEASGSVSEDVGRLEACYRRFTEGFDTADLLAARGLLDSMG